MNHQYTLVRGNSIFSRITKSVILLLVMGLFFLPTKSLQAQTSTCNFKAGNVTLVLSGQSTGAGITSQLVLTNSSGIIQYVSAANNTTLSNVAAGNYLAYGVTYDASTNPNLTVGGNVNSVGFCYKTTSIPLNVCDCNNATGTLSASVSGQTAIAGQVNKYVLTDGKGLILAIDNVPTFTGYGNGVYNIYGVSYDGNGTINGLAAGNNISSVSGSCVSVTPGTGYIVCLPELVVVKTGPATGTVGSNYNYTLGVSNNGVAPTSGEVTVTDELPSGLTFVSGSGSGWSCTANGQTVICKTSSSISPANTAPIINLTVTPTQTGSFDNTASVSGGGDNTPFTSNKVTTDISNPATPNLAIEKLGPTTGTVGVNFDYTLIVKNIGTAATNGALVTVTDIIPTGLTFVSATGTGWNCVASASTQTVSCTTNNMIPVSGSSNIILTVNPSSTGAVTNTANVIGGGDNTTSPSNPVGTVINAAPTPNLTLIKTGPATATVGVNFDYLLVVNNSGTAATSGKVTVTDELPAGLTFVSGTGAGWNCRATGQTVICETNNSILVNVNSVITLTVNPTSTGNVINKASVVGGGDSTPFISNDVPTTINPAPTPNLEISKSGPATGIVGTNYRYTLTVSNTGTSATTGKVTVTDALPSGLTFVSGLGTGWACVGASQTVTCESTTAIIVNGTSAIDLIVTPTRTGTYVNVASVFGGGDNTTSNSGDVTTQINPAPAPVLAIAKAGPATATVGVNYNYTLTVSNTGTSNTNGQISVTDVLPTGLNFVSGSGNGWSCAASNQTVTCVSNTSIAVGTNSAITLIVNPVLAGSYNNTASVNGGGTTGSGNSNTVNTNVGCPTNINPGVLKY